MTQVPDIRKGSHLIFVKCRYYCKYYKNGRVARKALGTEDYLEAQDLRNQFYARLILDEGATVRLGRSRDAKLADKPDLYISRRKPYVVMVPGNKPVYCETVEEARKERDKRL